MLGGSSEVELGIIPHLCDDLFTRITRDQNKNHFCKYRVEASYFEIYNEKIFDLLAMNTAKGASLRVREHSILGPYVDGLTKMAVSDFSQIRMLMDQGNRIRHTASTKMNDRSSRSHAVFTINLTQAIFDEATKQTGEKASRLSLVDLAGSERNSKTGTSGAQLKEGANINKSLSTLGLVISKLAAASTQEKHKGSPHIPYRDSALTFILKDSLGGNSKTVMVATISPSPDNYEETLSTLRYADRAKQIVNHAVVNEDPNAKLIRELKEELERLRSGIGSGRNGVSVGSDKELKEMRRRLEENERLIEELNMTWEEKLKATEEKLRAQQAMLASLGATIEGQDGKSLRVESRLPHFVDLSGGDSLSTEITIYPLREGITTIGQMASEPLADIELIGAGMEANHCTIEHKVVFNDIDNVLEEIVMLIPQKGECIVNGKPVTTATELNQGDAVMLGLSNMFRFNHPTQAERLRLLRKRAHGNQNFEGNDIGALQTIHEVLASDERIDHVLNPASVLEAKLEAKYKDETIEMEKKMAEAEKRADEEKARLAEVVRQREEDMKQAALEKIALQEEMNRLEHSRRSIELELQRKVESTNVEAEEKISEMQARLTSEQQSKSRHALKKRKRMLLTNLPSQQKKR
eukprot:UC4_evm1s1546